jgi:fluoroquinolone resistance protein
MSSIADQIRDGTINLKTRRFNGDKFEDETFTDIDFSDSRFIKVVFSRCIFIDCDFSNARLKVGFTDSTIRGCTFNNTNLDNSRFVRTVVEGTPADTLKFSNGCNFVSAKINRTQFRNVEFENCDFEIAEIKDCEFDNVIIHHESNLSHTLFENSSFDQTIFIINEAEFSIENCNFYNSKISGGNDDGRGAIHNSVFNNCSFAPGCEIEDCLFDSNTSISYCQFTSATFNNIHFLEASIGDSTFITCSFINVAFESSELLGVSIRETDLSLTSFYDTQVDSESDFEDSILPQTFPGLEPEAAEPTLSRAEQAEELRQRAQEAAATIVDVPEVTEEVVGTTCYDEVLMDNIEIDEYLAESPNNFLIGRTTEQGVKYTCYSLDNFKLSKRIEHRRNLDKYKKCAICDQPFTIDGDNMPILLVPCWISICRRCYEDPDKRPTTCPETSQPIEKAIVNWGIITYLRYGSEYRYLIECVDDAPLEWQSYVYEQYVTEEPRIFVSLFDGTLILKPTWLWDGPVPEPRRFILEQRPNVFKFISSEIIPIPGYESFTAVGADHCNQIAPINTYELVPEATETTGGRRRHHKTRRNRKGKQRRTKQKKNKYHKNHTVNKNGKNRLHNKKKSKKHRNH